MTRQVEGGSGYASQMMLPVFFGLGAATRIDHLEIDWPSGSKQVFDEAALRSLNGVNRVAWIEEGENNVTAIGVPQAARGQLTCRTDAKKSAL